jgi:hypothetical protein
VRSKRGQLINILMKDGTPRRVLRDQAEELLSKGKAKRYISKTVYKALTLGVEVKNPGTRDTDGKLKKQIRDLTEKEHKKDAKKKVEASE